MTKAETRWMSRIAGMNCICCELLGMQQEFGTEVHHIREGREERNSFLTLPLCGESCHRGPKGVHGDKTYLGMLKMSEYGLLAVVIERIAA